ncbi:unnamed protein product [Tilletia controversa]|nr:unnamed protein product [Tilletia controversa]
MFYRVNFTSKLPGNTVPTPASGVKMPKVHTFHRATSATNNIIKALSTETRVKKFVTMLENFLTETEREDAVITSISLQEGSGGKAPNLSEATRAKTQQGATQTLVKSGDRRLVSGADGHMKAGVRD